MGATLVEWGVGVFLPGDETPDILGEQAVSHGWCWQVQAHHAAPYGHTVWQLQRHFAKSNAPPFSQPDANTAPLVSALT